MLTWSKLFIKFTALCFALLLASGILLAQAESEQQFPDVVSVDVRATGDNTFDFDVTISSPYDTPTRYADAFHVSTLTGQVLGERELLHDHQTEQPFTRDLYGVKIPPAINVVIVQARDQKYGYGGNTVQVQLPGRNAP